MKRLFILALIPMMLSALETVNLIKDYSFEKDSEVWMTYAGGDGDLDSAVTSRHDAENAFIGTHSASSDTRTLPGDVWTMYDDSAMIIQGFCCQKVIADLDSLMVQYSVISLENNPLRSSTAFIALYINSQSSNYWVTGYSLHAPDLDPNPLPPLRYIEEIDFPSDSNWHLLAKNIRADLGIMGFSPDATVDSFLVMGWGGYLPPWRGQKIYWDDIRLMGYADYDVGVKEILSGDSLEVGTPYQLIARIKNFGLENADSFLVIAEIWDGSSLIYVDTLPWSLDGDTEDTVTFADFDPPTTGPYTLTVRTHMTPDECDEDDELSKEIGHTAIAEATLPEGLSLEVMGTSRGVLKVSFETPNGKVADLTVYDATGRRIERMAVTRSGSVTFNSALASGVYLVRLESKQATVTKKAVVLR